ncbi:MAG: 5-(carboxyamino)imidazole ribonucleotide synthase [Planctomycetes bacterium]|nr:5-(carboxyamino)imidazole ribonucleotide synthase [Planctomycetota bacterium]
MKQNPESNQRIDSIHSTVGIVGGGQLAKMLAHAAYTLGCQVFMLVRERPFPADSLDTRCVVGDWNDPGVLVAFARDVDVVMLESEFVDAHALEALEKAGCSLCPSAATVRCVQDKLLQKTAMAEHGLAVPAFRDTPTPNDVLAAGEEFGWPIVLKKRRNGYDGKGNALVESEADIEAAWHQLDGDRSALFADAFCPFVRELAMIITRAADGTTAPYPLVESRQEDHICKEILVPAPVHQELARRAQRIAEQAVLAVNGTGSFGIELFELADGNILINELAPRVHNTGHYSIEACDCSQFENHVRAVLGLPLGSTALRRPAAAMVNVLASVDGSGRAEGFAEALAVSGAHVHLYGKHEARVGRKMGHVTALGEDIDTALRSARTAASNIRFVADGSASEGSRGHRFTDGASGT